MTTVPQITAEDALELIRTDDRALLVDVRTETEWRHVGVPDLTGLGRDVRFVSWTDEQGRPNPYFTDLATDGLDSDAPILLLCRSGARSNAAAQHLIACGFNGAHNIIAGFEGPVGPSGKREGGWKDSLPSGEWHPAR